MPIHDYACEKCHYLFDVFRPRVRRDEMRCPRYGTTRLVHLVSRSTPVSSFGASSSCSTSSGIG
jgi:putative FmdB family regulatory protein